MIRQAAIQQLAARYGGRAREEAYLEFAQERGYLAKGNYPRSQLTLRYR
jgi:hypothetical protein